jgi:hypothetical protein
MSQTDTLLNVPPGKTDRAVPRPVASLIEVPDVRRPPSGRARSSGFGRWDRGRRSRPRPKRRLRREVRFAGAAMLALAPLLSACTVGWSNRPDRVLACSIAEATAPDGVVGVGADPRDAYGRSVMPPVSSPGVVVLSSGAAVTPPGTDTEVPVVFPGYVLPDDSLEESTHEGS